jgi:hypothetical protein
MAERTFSMPTANWLACFASGCRMRLDRGWGQREPGREPTPGQPAQAIRLLSQLTGAPLDMSAVRDRTGTTRAYPDCRATTIITSCCCSVSMIGITHWLAGGSQFRVTRLGLMATKGGGCVCRTGRLGQAARAWTGPRRSIASWPDMCARAVIAPLVS